jgi:DNA-binding CsgD family transcriptional regulator/transcriptional regulator with XRE-family HTH domain
MLETASRVGTGAGASWAATGPADEPGHALAGRIRRLRARLRLSQASLGAALGVSKLTVLRWEQGQAQPSVLAQRQLARLDLAFGTADTSGPDDDRPLSDHAALAPAQGPAYRAAPRLPVLIPPASVTGFFGRSRELEVLQRALDTAQAGHGGMVHLVGEPGIGKTRMAQELATLAGRRGFSLLWGRCFEGDWVPAYCPWADALDSYVRGIDPGILVHELGEGAALLSQFLPSLRALLPALPVIAPLPPAEARLRLSNAVADLLLGATRQAPVLLVLDDVHWADRGSLDLLRFLGRLVPGMALVLCVAYRDVEVDREHPLAVALSALRRDPGYRSLSLSGLSEAETAGVLAQRLGAPVSDALSKTIHQRTSGNPFFIAELARAIEEAGDDPGPHPPPAVPEGVRQVVRQRLRRLGPETGEVLMLATGLGGGFGVPLLQALADLPQQQLLHCLDEAERARLIEPMPGSPERYVFVHAIVRDTLYAELGSGRRMRLHRQIAEALETVYSDTTEEHAAELAAHYHASAGLAGAERGLPHALAAAEQMLTRFAPARAADFLRIALALSAGSGAARRATILCRLAVAQAEGLLLGEAQQTVEEALAALDASGASPDTVAGFLANAAGALQGGGAGSGAWRPLIERGLALLGKRHDLTWARLIFLRRDGDRYETLSHGAIRTARWFGTDPRVVAIARAEGDEELKACTIDQQLWLTREETDALHDLAGRWQRPSAVIAALHCWSKSLLYQHGAFREAVSATQELLSASQRWSSVQNQVNARFWLARTRAALGDLDEAEEQITAGLTLVTRLGAEHPMSAVASWQSGFIACYREGDWRRLAASWERLATDPVLEMRWFAPVAAGAAAFAYARAGAPAPARGLLDDLTPILERAGPRDFAHNGAVALAASAVWELGDVEYAARYRRLALDLIEAGVGDYPCCSNELTTARMAALEGRLGEADAYFARARRTLEASGQRPLRAILDYDEALACQRRAASSLRQAQDEQDNRQRGDRSHSLQLLDASEEEFRALRMAGWVSRAQALRTRLSHEACAESDRRRANTLSKREQEILRLLAEGRGNRQIADELVLSVRTVEYHLVRIYDKLGVGSRAAAVACALGHDGGNT